jgi:predicted regulator of Ras-like GTPase activity (Roadblock/LC7/MglB family)
VKTILEQLNRSVGINGSAVISRDGIPVVSVIPDRASEDKMAAIGASLIRAVVRGFGQLADGEVQSVSLEASRGRILLVNAGAVFLVVVIDPNISMDSTMLDIKSAANRLRRAASLDGANTTTEARADSCR